MMHDNVYDAVFECEDIYSLKYVSQGFKPVRHCSFEIMFLFNNVLNDKPSTTRIKQTMLKWEKRSFHYISIIEYKANNKFVCYSQAEYGSDILPDRHQAAALVDRATTRAPSGESTCHHQGGSALPDAFRVYTCNQCYMLFLPEMMTSLDTGRVYNDGTILLNGSVVEPDLTNRLAS